jgi:MFS family permease
MSLVNATGSGLWMTGSALFFTKVVGVTAAQVGLGLSLAGVVGVATTLPVGALVDRFGSRRMYVALVLWRAAGFVAYAFVRGFAGFLAVACVLGAADRVMGPVTQSLVSSAVRPDERVRTMGYLVAARNAGFTLGGALASVMISVFGATSYTWLVLGNAASFILAVPVVRTIPSTEPAAGQRAFALLRSALPKDWRFLRLAIVNGALVAHFTLLTVTIPLWLVTRTTAPKTLLGAMLMINTIGASTCQVTVSATTGDVRAAAARFRQAGLALALCCCVVAVTGSTSAVIASALLVLAIVLLTVAELTQSAAGWQVSFALSAEGRSGSYLAAFNLGESVQTVLGPVVLTWLVVTGGWIGWLAVAAMLLAAGLAGRRFALAVSPSQAT